MQRLAQEGAGDPAGDLIIARRGRGLAEDLPQGTARERVIIDGQKPWPVDRAIV